MEPVTHMLTGTCLARAGCNRKAAYATATMAIAAEFPDIDTLWGYLGGPVVGFQHHRGITHTLLGFPFEAGLIVGGVFLVHRWRERRAARRPATSKPLTAAPVRWAVLYGFALLALLSHIFLDFTNNYGIRPFFPFHPQWFAGSFVFIFDPVLFLLLLSAFVVPPLFGLIGTEVGARHPAFRGTGWARAVLVLMVAFWSFRYFEHGRAQVLGEAQSRQVSPLDPDSTETHRFAQPVRVLANPDPFSPFTWHLVSDFGDFYQLADADTRTGALTASQDIHPKPAQTTAIRAAAGSQLGRAYLDWSPMPLLTESTSRDGAQGETTEEDPQIPGATLVTFRDPRFMLDLPILRGRTPLTGAVLLDDHLRVVQQTMDGKTQR